MWERAVVEASVTFGRHLDADLDDGAWRRAHELIEETLIDGIENRGYAWDEPLRTFILREVGRIARRASRLAEGGSISADMLNDAFETVRTNALAVIEERGGIGPKRRPEGFSLCFKVRHPFAPPEFADPNVPRPPGEQP